MLFRSLLTSDVLNLKPGDVMQLESRVGEDVVVRLNGVEKFAAVPVRTEKKKAVQILHPIYREFKNE